MKTFTQILTFNLRLTTRWTLNVKFWFSVNISEIMPFYKNKLQSYNSASEQLK